MSERACVRACVRVCVCVCVCVCVVRESQSAQLHTNTACRLSMTAELDLLGTECMHAVGGNAIHLNGLF